MVDMLRLKEVAVLGAPAIGFQAPSHVGPIVRAVFYASLQQKMSAGPSATARNTNACQAFASGKVTSAAFSPDGTRMSPLPQTEPRGYGTRS